MNIVSYHVLLNYKVIGDHILSILIVTIDLIFTIIIT